MFFRGKYSFLSNFHPCRILYDGVLYPTLEHAYQAAKTSNPKQREKIKYAETPAAAKRLGQHVELRSDWDRIKLGVMEELLRIKFSHKSLRKQLTATQGEELVEHNDWNDTFWGRCQGRGENHLGKLLMKLRQEFLTRREEPAFLKHWRDHESKTT